MSYELTGKLIEKSEIVQRTETFKTREFVIEKSEDIGGRTVTNFAKFQCVQDKTAIIDRVNVGDEVKVYFNIRGILSQAGCLVLCLLSLHLIISRLFLSQ